MFIIDKENNRIEKIEKTTFSNCGFSERYHLQEWIANNENSLGEELLIIQKEFDGFNDTNERLDLLALDKDGNLVIIENKLDDSGRDVVWQSLKYTSYCSTLTSNQIKDIYQQYLNKNNINKTAENNILEFLYENSEDISFDDIVLNAGDQRIIMIAANFRKEVTSTAMWLLNRGIKIQCFTATPYNINNLLLLDLKQIIPVKEAEEYIIKLADKEQEEKEKSISTNKTKEIRREFWTNFLAKFNEVSDLFKNISPTYDNWLSTSSGLSGVNFTFTVNTKYSSIGLTIEKSDKEENKSIFDKLYLKKDSIELNLGKALEWDRLSNHKRSKVFLKLDNINGLDKENWEEIFNFFCEYMPKFEKTIQKEINSLQI